MKVPSSTLTILAVSAAGLLPTIVYALTFDSFITPRGLLSKRGYYWEDGKQYDMSDIMCLPHETAVCGDSKLTRDICADNCFCMYSKTAGTHKISCLSRDGCPLQGKTSLEEQCKCKSKPDLGKCSGVNLKHSDGVRGWPPTNDTDYACPKDAKDEKGCIKV